VSSGGSVLSAGARPLPEYELVRRLGRGGFGEVWLAKGPGGFDVALKFVRLGEQADHVELRALELMKGIRHGNLLPIFGTWQRDDLLVVATELADRSLLDRLHEARATGREGIPRDELLEYMRDAARGLDHLNEWRDPAGASVGIQHKDVKPQNLLLVGGTVKVADFGLAKLLEHTVSSASGGMTPAYAAPEFLEGQATRWSDQYCLAVTYCHLRGGRRPFAGNHAQILAGHLMQPPDLGMVPPEERPAVARALAKKPSQRWPSCRAFVAALQAAAGGAAAQAPALEEGAAPDPPPAAPGPLPTPEPAVGRAPGRRERDGVSPWPLLAAGGLMALAVVAAALLLTINRPSDPTTRAGPSPPGPVAVTRPALLDCTGEGGVSAAEVRRAQQAWATYLGRNVEEEVEIADGVKMTFVLVPPGKFGMGSPEAEEKRSKDEVLHTVLLTEPIDLSRTEVTQAQYKALTGINLSYFRGDDRPVERVRWGEAVAYARKLEKARGGQHRYRLPTEAEWEYACRGGRPSSQPFGIGDGRSLSSGQANFNGNDPYGGAARGPYLEKTCAVGSYAANAFGLHDMHGNVFEWCADCPGPYPRGEVTNPTISADDSYRVVRGGSWHYGAGGCRAAARFAEKPGMRQNHIGFRLARSFPPGGK
jgi:formylglycine-generating enzyme required for sulfatase activity